MLLPKDRMSDCVMRTCVQNIIAAACCYTSRTLNSASNIVLEIFRWCDGTYLEDQDFYRFTGIARDTYIYTREKNRLEDIRVTASADGKTTRQ